MKHSKAIERIQAEGISDVEVHVLRNIVKKAGSTGVIDSADPAMSEWRKALHVLVRRGLVCAYRPTELGEHIDNMIHDGRLGISSSTSACPSIRSRRALPKRSRTD